MKQRIKEHNRILSVMVTLLLALLVAAAAFGATAPVVTNQTPISTGLSTPVRVVADSAGNLYVADPRARGIMQYTPAGNLISRISTTRSPMGIAFTAGNDLLVSQGTYVALLSRSGSFAETRQLAPTGGFKMANGIAVASDGTIFVTDSLDDCVHVFNANYSYRSRFGTTGTATGQFSLPTGIAYEKAANQVAVADTLNSRIQFFSTAGLFQKVLGSPGMPPTGNSGPPYANSTVYLSSPQNISFEYTRDTTPQLSRIFIVDSFQSIVQTVDPANNALLLIIGRYGVHAGQGELFVPADVLFEPTTNRLFVANGQGNLAIFGIDGGAAGSDTVPPVVTVVPRPGTSTVTNVSSITLTGTVNETATITVTANTAAVIGPVTFPTATTWNCTVSGLASSANIISVKGTDLAGNQSATESLTVTYSPTAPALTVNAVTSPTRNTSLTLSGTVATGATVTVTADTAATVGSVTQSGTSWSTPVSNLPNGDTILTVTATASGLPNAVATALVTVHNITPALTVSTLTNGSTSASPLLNVSGITDTGDISAAVLTFNGQQQAPVPVVNGQFHTMVQLQPGSNTLVVSVTDTVGNSVSETRTIAYDGTAPGLDITTPADGSAVTATTLPVIATAPVGTVAGTLYKPDGNTAPITFSQSGTTWTASPSPILDAGIGLYTVDVAATSGSLTSHAKRTILLVDATAQPTLIIDGPVSDRFVNSSTATITGTTSGSSITVTVNGTTQAADLSTGTFSIPLTFGAEGPYAVMVTVYDAAGNATTNTRTLVYAISGPDLSLTSQSSTLISGTGTPGSTVYINDSAGVQVGMTVIPNSGIWSITLTGTESAPLNIYAIGPTGTSSRNGKITGGAGEPTIVDAYRALRIAARIEHATSDQLLRGDVAPLVTALPRPDGKIGVNDVRAILRRVLGLPWQ
ncbi:MAG: SMP-30/gluconolactonase/LRE family protein [Geobacter sp.]|nr:SMP-30/gluconolactonase/LRE family protein [Geobacter sp.]